MVIAQRSAIKVSTVIPERLNVQVVILLLVSLVPLLVRVNATIVDQERKPLRFPTPVNFVSLPLTLLEELKLVWAANLLRYRPQVLPAVAFVVPGRFQMMRGQPVSTVSRGSTVIQVLLIVQIVILLLGSLDPLRV